ncbi:hypothetical protein MMAGJ_01580 [Mycolicibacterium mageritense]|uniref:Uncharacterized protein n=1 Tax=Mycolicibacterium mageritense TaxID=53462 RepID=A0ABM7HK61_MYCME|nr:hypothetical protein MMAGJ_01580 [Mycolicibacterium mageritense]
MSPPSEFSAVRIGSGALGRSPLLPSVTGNPPTRFGSNNIDVARPCTTVPHAVSRTAQHMMTSHRQSPRPVNCPRLSDTVRLRGLAAAR